MYYVPDEEIVDPKEYVESVLKLSTLPEWFSILAYPRPCGVKLTPLEPVGKTWGKCESVTGWGEGGITLGIWGLAPWKRKKKNHRTIIWEIVTSMFWQLSVIFPARKSISLKHLLMSRRKLHLAHWKFIWALALNIRRPESQIIKRLLA